MLVIEVCEVVQTKVERDDIPAEWISTEPALDTSVTPVGVIIIPGRVQGLECQAEVGVQIGKITHAD